MQFEQVIELKRLPFSEKIRQFDKFVTEENCKGTISGRVGLAPVGPLQKFSDGASSKLKEVLMFGSNSYLGLSNELAIKEHVANAVKKFGLGSGGSPAFSGLTVQQKEVENRLALLSGHSDAMIVAGGYIANLTWISALVGSDDVIIYDRNSHASTIDGFKLANVQHIYSFNTHNTKTLKHSLEASIKKYPKAKIFLTVEGVRSIDGSVADIGEMLRIVSEFHDKAFFILDDAHGLGTLGEKGYGTLEYLDLMGQVDLRMSTCSKAMGIQGAFLTGDSAILNYIRTMANPYNYTTAMSQPVISAIDAALTFMENHPERLRQLHINKEYMWDRLTEYGFNIYKAPSGIIPIFLPQHVDHATISRELFNEGLFVNVFYYPLITPGQERIRLSMMATHTKEHLDAAIDVLQRVCRKHKVI